ncbi:C40 family peptidase [Oceanobacillus sojae]|uniref:C40 family peptidase n=1 Tax=Oceanobacillus sojae TaxID=582851 RepID=UPI0009889339|nr:C40 family peptidase [Oceanobacillus sojae]MCT1904408.1 NlpC/P60 family protein [Oceanobacillus sojae]
MKKTVMTLTAASVVGLSSVFFSGPVKAESVEDLETRQSQVQDDRDSVQANLSDAENEVADVLVDLQNLQQEIDDLNSALEKNQQKLDETEGDITTTEDEISELKAEIDELEEAIEKRTEILKERAVSLQQNGGDISYLEVLFGAQDFSDFVGRVSAVNKITDSDLALLEQQEEDKQEVADKQESVESKLDELNQLKTDLTGINNTITEQKDVAEDKESSLKDKETELTALIDDLQIEDSRLAAIEEDVADRLEVATAPAPETLVASVSVGSNEDSSEEEAGNSENESNNEPAEQEEASASQEEDTASNNEDNNSGNSDNSSTTAESGSSSNSGSSESGQSSAPKKAEKKEEPKKEAAPTGSGISAVLSAAQGQTYQNQYVWGGKSPSTGFDCSGFVSWAFAQAGYSIPSYTGALVGTGKAVDSSDKQPGDLVFFNTNGTNGHVGIYLGNNKFIGSQSSTGVAVADMSPGSYWGGEFSGTVRRVH